MKPYFFISAAMAGLLAGNAVAGTMGPVVKDLNWVGSISAGPVWARGSGSEVEKTYVAMRSTDRVASGELFIGLQKNLSSTLRGQLGLAAATTGNTRLQGLIWNNANHQFNTSHYKIRHNHIAVKGKLLLDDGYWLAPWVSGSLGVGFNRAYNFTTNLALHNANFGNHTKTAFTYTLGTGVQKYINDNWQIGVGYEFADWGKSKLGRSLTQTVNSGLKLNHLYTNGVLFNITYLT
jgi:opacity protein-like surface antigen